MHSPVSRDAALEGAISCNESDTFVVDCIGDLLAAFFITEVGFCCEIRTDDILFDTVFPIFKVLVWSTRATDEGCVLVICMFIICWLLAL